MIEMLTVAVTNPAFAWGVLAAAAATFVFAALRTDEGALWGDLFTDEAEQ